MTTNRPRGRGSPDDQADHVAEPGQPGHDLDDGEGARDRREQPDSRVASETERGEAGNQHGGEQEIPPGLRRRDLDRPKAVDEERISPDQSLIVAHGARSILVTFLVAVMVLVSIAVAPSAELPWHHTALAWAGLALAAFGWSRLAAPGGVLPIGVHGDSRFIVAAIATFFIAVMSPETVALIEVPFFLLLLAAGLCGLADGAWIATAMRQLNLPFLQALGAFLRTAGSALRIESSRPGDGP